MRPVQAAGVGGAPPGAAAVLVNVTATATSDHGYLTIWPSATPMPLASSLNWRPGQTIANAVTVALSPSAGSMDVHNASGTVDVVMDTAGWYG